LFKQEGAIGILEYSTIPQGMKVLNDIVKGVKLTYIQAKIFPGAKYMIIMQGEHGSIEYAMEIGMEQEGLFDIGWMGKIHSLMVPVFNEESCLQDKVENVIIFQQNSHAKAFELCNMLLHRFDVSVVQFKHTEVLEGHSVVILSGSIADIRGVKASIQCGEILTNVEPWILEEVVR
jgi:microcompartment protein CcmL/EutN